MDPQSRQVSGSRLCRGADRQMTGVIKNPSNIPQPLSTTALLNKSVQPATLITLRMDQYTNSSFTIILALHKLTTSCRNIQPTTSK